MFDYKYAVISSNDNLEWGIFKTKGQATIMKDALIEKFSNITFEVKEII
jgi:hypothetical protein